MSTMPIGRRKEEEKLKVTPEELYKIYAGWTGSLHYYAIKHLGRHIDCEFLPDSYEFRVFSGHAEDGALSVWAFQTVPTLVRPPGEERAVIQLPKPQDNPTSEQLDEVFRQICLAAARVLSVDLGKPKLAAPAKSMLISKKKKNESLPAKRLKQ